MYLLRVFILIQQVSIYVPAIFFFAVCSYSLQPLFTASFAYILLGETMDTSGYVGGGLILAAVLLVASKQQRSEETSE